MNYFPNPIKAVVALVATVLFATLSSSQSSQEPATFPLPGEWPAYRREGSLQSRSPLKGNIVHPKIAWKHFVGLLETTFILEPGPGEAVLSLPGEPKSDSNREAGDSRWGLAPRTGWIEGREQPFQNEGYVAYAEILPDGDGMEKIVVDKEGTVSCLAWRNNLWEEVWETEKQDFGGAVAAYPIVDDFDSDGALEVAFLPWWNLFVLDATTGRTEQVCRFTEGRSYGYFGAHDLNRDGTSEFVVLADFAKHIDVLGYREGKLELLWQRNIELDISNPQNLLRVNPDSVSDLDGDGNRDIVVSLCEPRTVPGWRVVVFEGMTGRVKAEFPDEILQGVADVDLDGASEVLTLQTSGSLVPEFGAIRIRSLRTRVKAPIWEKDDARWETGEKVLPLHINSGATYAREAALARKTGQGCSTVFREKVSETEDRLTVLRWESDTPQEVLKVQGPRARGLALDPKGALLMQAQSSPGSDGKLQVHNGTARILETAPRSAPAATVVSASPSDSIRPTIVAQGLDELVAFHPPLGDQSARELWRVRGRGQSTTWPATYGPVIADLEGDGRRQVLYGASSPEGCARLVAMNLDGTEVWNHDFPTIPGTPPVWNSGALILWQTGNFTNANKQDALVTFRRSMMHSDETVLLSGRDGREMWKIDRLEVEYQSRGVGGTPFALADFDRDGLLDLASFYPSLFYILAGKTGDPLRLMGSTWEPVPAKPVYWGIPIAGAFQDEDQPSVLMAGASMTAMVRADGTLAWWDALDKSPNQFAVGDFDGDQRIEAVGFGFEGKNMRCYDTATGAMEWEAPCPYDGSPIGVASGDVDGDGREEALVVVGARLYCIGSTEGAYRLLWELPLPCQSGPPSIVSLKQGELTVLVMGEDGNVYGIE